MTPRVNVRRPEGGGQPPAVRARLHRRSFTTDPALSWAHSLPFLIPPCIADIITGTSINLDIIHRLLTFSAASSGLPVLPRNRHDKTFRSASHLNPNVFKSSQDGPTSSRLSPRPALPTVTGVKTVQNCQKPEKPFVRAALRPGHY